MGEEFCWEKLSPSLFICVSSAHKFGTDAFLLSDFAAPRRKDLCCDLGTGCGIIPLLWFRDDPPACATGRISKSRQLSNWNNPFKKRVKRPLHPTSDRSERTSFPSLRSLDLVTCNPPYKAQGSGILSETDAERIARHEVLCTIEDVCQAASRLFAFRRKTMPLSKTGTVVRHTMRYAQRRNRA